jgi:hypothetical protein
MKKPGQYTTENVVICPSTNPHKPELILTVTPDSSGWGLYLLSSPAIERGQRLVFQEQRN